MLLVDNHDVRMSTVLLRRRRAERASEHAIGHPVYVDITSFHQNADLHRTLERMMVMLDHNAQRWHSSIGRFQKDLRCHMVHSAISTDIVAGSACQMPSIWWQRIMMIKHSEGGTACETATASPTHVYRICENLNPNCQQADQFPGV